MTAVDALLTDPVQLARWVAAIRCDPWWDTNHPTFRDDALALIEKLAAENARLRESKDGWSRMGAHLQTECDALRAANARLQDTLETVTEEAAIFGSQRDALRAALTEARATRGNYEIALRDLHERATESYNAFIAARQKLVMVANYLEDEERKDVRAVVARELAAAVRTTLAALAAREPKGETT